MNTRTAPGQTLRTFKPPCTSISRTTEWPSPKMRLTSLLSVP